MTSTSTKHSTNISLLKLVFVLCIVMMHYFVPWHVNSYFMKGAYIYVEFFFLLQGFFLDDVLRKLSPNNAEKQYVVTRLRRFFPIVTVQAFILLILELMFFCGTFKECLFNVVGTMYQISFVSVILTKNMLNNATMWFLSAYIIGGTIAIYIIKRYPLYRGGICNLHANLQLFNKQSW